MRSKSILVLAHLVDPVGVGLQCSTAPGISFLVVLPQEYSGPGLLHLVSLQQSQT